MRPQGPTSAPAVESPAAPLDSPPEAGRRRVTSRVPEPPRRQGLAGRAPEGPAELGVEVAGRRRRRGQTVCLAFGEGTFTVWSLDSGHPGPVSQRVRDGD